MTAEHFDRYKTKRLKDMTGEYTEDKNEKKLKPISPVTVNIELRAVRPAMGKAVRWKLIESNPFQELQQVRVPDLPPSFLTKADFQKLLAVIGGSWLRELVIFAVSTGMRQGEMLNLRWQDVDLERKVIHIHSEGTFRTKQGKQRTIPMNTTIHTMLSARAIHSTGDLVFTRRDVQIPKNYIQHRFKHYVREAGLDGRLHWHSLRHTHASWLVQDGVSLREVQVLLGHSSSKVTEVYSHLQPEQLHGTVNRIDVSLN